MTAKTLRKRPKSDQRAKNCDDIVQLVHAALSGRTRDVQIVARRLAKNEPNSERATELTALLSRRVTEHTPFRRHNPPMPLDQDSRLELLRVESPVVLENEPVYASGVQHDLARLLEEHRSASTLRNRGLHPTRTALFTGLPGVGKTLAARWLARELDLPLLTLDLSAVMSSYLGRTGGNVKAVLEYAKATPSILLLDELDAIAKRRDDTHELGELKRLVTVLLQEIDHWPNDRLMIAATNHADLLDPAVWRRFEAKLAFEPPDAKTLRAFTRRLLVEEHADDQWIFVLSTVFAGQSHNEIEHYINRARRDVALGRETLDGALGHVVGAHARSLGPDERQRIALVLVNDIGLSQRSAHELTGVSRDTLRKRLRAARGEV